MSTNDTPTPENPATDSTPGPARGASTLLETLQSLAGAGYKGQFVPSVDGTIRCSTCQMERSPAEFDIEGFVRLEGASDAADLNLVCWSTCPSCGNGGVLTVGYGPNATEADVAVLPDLQVDDVDEPGALPDEADATP